VHAARTTTRRQTSLPERCMVTGIVGEEINEVRTARQDCVQAPTKNDGCLKIFRADWDTK